MTSTQPDMGRDTQRTFALSTSRTVSHSDVRPRRGVRSAVALITFLGIAGVVGAFGGLTSASAINGWYAAAAKPMFTPPDAVFGPVWAVLYTMIAVAGWLVWRRPDSEGRTRALRLFGAQFVLNALWSPMFFGLGDILGAPGLWAALVLIVVLNVVVLATIIRVGEVCRVAAVLLVPYWLWSLFATTLNAAIAVLAS